jgi:predicted ATP-grasp superfamily ATP-dependent carboligase
LKFEGLTLKILVYEHISGGGYAEQPLPPDVLAEGFAMLRCIVADFRAAGHQVSTLLDCRLFKLNPPIEANYISQVLYANEPQKILLNLAKNNDVIYIIAPETNQTLQSYVELAEKTGKTLLNTPASTIAKTADKTTLYVDLQKTGYAIPKTLILNVAHSTTQIEQALTTHLTYPLIFKPADGAGCSGISLIETPKDILSGVAKIKAASANPRFIAQEKIDGDTVSVSLLSNGKKAMAFNLNKQQITLAKQTESSYQGGSTPYEHPKTKEAKNLAERIVESLGLQGYVGIDLILNQNTICVLDVNARLTVSYVGLRQIINFNIAQALLDTIITKQLPQTPNTQGTVCFSKIHTTPPTSEIYRKTTKLPGVITPIFPLPNTPQSVALIMGYGTNLQEAQTKLEEAKKTLYTTTTTNREV